MFSQVCTSVRCRTPVLSALIKDTVNKGPLDKMWVANTLYTSGAPFHQRKPL